METRQRRKITITPREAARYVRTIAEWNANLRTQCARREIGFAAVTTDVPFEEVVQMILRRGGLVA